ncbi:MAG TPA: hypothetical protein VIL46_18155 [Gemmataceae bacterium]
MAKPRDEGPVSEITILPDGRVYFFGLTRPLLEVLAALPVRESIWREMHLQLDEPAQPVRPQESRP